MSAIFIFSNHYRYEQFISVFYNSFLRLKIAAPKFSAIKNHIT
jgi:hypothetical protein